MASQRDAKGQAVSLCQSKQEVPTCFRLEKGRWAWSSLLFLVEIWDHFVHRGFLNLVFYGMGAWYIYIYIHYISFFVWKTFFWSRHQKRWTRKDGILQVMGLFMASRTFSRVVSLKIPRKKQLAENLEPDEKGFQLPICVYIYIYTYYLISYTTVLYCLVLCHSALYGLVSWHIMYLYFILNKYAHHPLNCKFLLVQDWIPPGMAAPVIRRFANTTRKIH